MLKLVGKLHSVCDGEEANNEGLPNRIRQISRSAFGTYVMIDEHKNNFSTFGRQRRK